MEIRLFSTINRSYRVPFCVTVHSLVSRKASTTRLVWHVFASDFSEEDRHFVEEKIRDPRLELVWHTIFLEEERHFPRWGRYVPEIYQRILVPDLPDLQMDRLLYIDADMLVLDGIEELWEADLAGHVLGAVQDSCIPHVSSDLGLHRYRRLGLHPEDPYFNAGVYLVDVERWKRGEIGKRVAEYLTDSGGAVNLLDQDALNAVLAGRWRRLDCRWNLLGGLAGRDFFQPPFDFGVFQRALESPGIIHFAGRLKPWKYRTLGSLWHEEYVRILSRLFPDYRFENSFRSFWVSLYDRHFRSVLYPLEYYAWKKLLWRL